MSEDAKRVAGEAAAELVEDGMVLGYGTGSTVGHFLTALARRRVAVRGIPTSQGTAARCRELGLALITPEEVDAVDLAVDGADELDAELSLVKGGGGALLREKVVAAMAHRFVVIATEDKQVERLGRSFPLPVEVVPFAWAPVQRTLAARGLEVTLRGGIQAPVHTDNGNLLLDCRAPDGIDDPAVTEVTIGLVPGVAETGLFVGLAGEALLGTASGGVTHVVREASPAA